MSGKSEKPTKNDLAWNALFEKYDILGKVSNQGSFEIEARQINQFRESRLMAKFDHRASLPKVFRDNHLSILPVSRTKYIIGFFNTYQRVQYDTAVAPTAVSP